MKIMRKIIEIDEELCNGCGLCVPDCAEGSLVIIDGKARMVSDKLCDGLGACLGSCPTGALQIIEREAEDFDEEAVEKHLAEQKYKATPPKPSGCPSAQIKTFAPQTPCQGANRPIMGAGGGASALTHWPVQIRLVPHTAPFLQGADLLVAADCCAVSAPNFQQDFLTGKIVMMGCPKFDDAEMYVQRFSEVIANCNLNSLTILIMEVPCCSSMNGIIKQAMERAGKSVPVEQITISTQGTVLERKNW
ncbi:MAG: 4Fe-4S ferredoxin [Proteobacteria bacterium]|nr:4Fe-4S ferredoxin [Pseudomonadota bacterium]MBU1419330.1 4Fe-4S ferredoxin [Pseudomonadota bacterium]MBU1455161.1 4Fe-4S ferredoxin [Pseudomonadota bacterium]